MLNSKAFKKLAALTAAVALVGSFAVSASAAVTTKTTYVGSDIKVEVSVDGLTSGDFVTYYAEADGTPYHVDQATANEAGVAEFDPFVTGAAKLNTNVLVDGETKVITGRTISVVNGTSDITVLPTEEKSATVVVNFTPDENMKVTGATATGAKVDSCEPSEAGKWSVVLSDIEGDVVITMTQEEEEVDDSTGEFIAAGKVVEEGKTKITILGKVLNLKDGVEYGAKIGETAYKALAKGEQGHFAIQVVVDELAAGSYTPAIYWGANVDAGDAIVQ